MFVDVGRFLAPIVAMGTLEPWLLAALVGQVSVQRVLLAVGAGAVRARELLRPKVIVKVREWRLGPEFADSLDLAASDTDVEPEHGERGRIWNETGSG